ncbi:MAG TPA: glucan biosynthesis protein G [Candidatus Acidoferrales bacterium]|nr:glucan biosynthesis protein G [Candidatus Acidoferrales bacterium]
MPSGRPHPLTFPLSTLTHRATLLALFVLYVCGSDPSYGAFNLDAVADKAQKMASESFQEPHTVPDWLTRISYDQWRDIRYRADRALWRDGRTPFQVQFFHPGLYYNRAIAVNVVEDNRVRAVDFSPNDFDYGHNDFASRVPQNLGFAGLRIHAPIKTSDYFDEAIVFLGASYFRAVGRDEVFGLSARGLAIDTALPSGEEFPFFREFWVVKPAPWAKSIAIYAILDSASLTGAYRFIVHPGDETTVDVEARLFFRRQVQKLGIAPLTSMFFHGENSPRGPEDFRPEVHDSDGLLLHFVQGEWLWRPLSNPRTLQVSSFKMLSPKGFGLLQRDRNFAQYEDLETHFEKRPSAWIEPRGDWAMGGVDLVEIPTKSDTNDNIVSFWVPDKMPPVGESMAVRYTVHWFGDDPGRPPGGRVIATRRDRGNKADAYRFVLDFAGGDLATIPDDAVVRGAVSVASGGDVADILDQQVVKNPNTGGWRLTFQIHPKTSDPIELRAYLDQNNKALTETWSYVLIQ